MAGALKLVFLAALTGSVALQARILDDFNGASLSGWTSTLQGGSVTQAGGVLTVTPAPINKAYTYTKKTSETFSNAADHTLEFKVLVNSVSNDGLALVGWVPVGGVPGANGYFVGYSANALVVYANSGVVYQTAFPSPLPTTDVQLVLRMTTSGGNVTLKTTAYKKAEGFQNVLFERTIANVPPLIGIAGNAIVGAWNTSATATTAVLDDLQTFDTVRVLLDDFSGPYPGGNWTDYSPGTATNYNDLSGHLVTVDQSAGPTSGTFYSSRSFKVSDGVRLELRVDVVDQGGSVEDFAILGYIPNGPTDFATLTEYHLAFTAAQFYVGKKFGVWWDAGHTLFPPTGNVRLIQTLTGEGSTVRIESRLEDLSKDINDPARVFYQYMKVDNQTDAYINKDGYFALSQYRNNPPGNNATIWDNAEVNMTEGGNAAPLISGQTPANGKSFYTASGGVSFDVKDDVSAPIDSIKLTLNGVVYTNGSPGVTITPSTGSSISRHFTLTGLQPNAYYVGNIEASDNLGSTSKLHYEFDTFLTSNLQIEAEDFNYSNDQVTGGLFIDGGVNGYANQQGLAEVDFHDSRNKGDSGNPVPYRPEDAPRQYPTGESPRPQYVSAGGTEYLLYDNANGDWRNYTRTFEAGTYKVYSRQSTFALPASLVSLDRVTGDRTAPNQTTAPLGSFIQLGDAAGDTGYDVHRNVLLTDVSGNPAIVRFAGGVDTLRVTDRSVDDAENSDVFHNYLVLVPTTDPGKLRPIVAAAFPVPGSTARQSPIPDPTYASIANRDTTVSEVVSLQLNGVGIAFTKTNTASGIDVGWSVLSTPAAPSITATLVLKDSENVLVTNSWSYSYPMLRAANRLVGTLAKRGFDYRMVQADAYEGSDNTIAKGEDQLAIPSSVPFDRTWRTNVMTLDWDDGTGVPKYVPGLDDGPSGYNRADRGPYDFIAVEALAYIELKAGMHRFGVISDDSFELRSGSNPSDKHATVLGYHNGSFSDFRTFDFLVEADGLYPIRCLWQEEGGGAAFHLTALDPVSNTYKPVNDPSDTSGVVRVFFPGTPIVIQTEIQSSSTLAGTYVKRTDASINDSTKTVTLPVSGEAQFFKLSSDTQLTIKSVSVSGGTVTIKY